MTDNNVYADLKPAQLWRHFAALNNIARPSGKEAAAREYARKIAVESGAQGHVDNAGNLIVRVSARNGGRADAPVVAVQSHLDMVCEKRPEIKHDFSADPITPRREGDFIFASGTTLGADNGIGIAAALAILSTPGLRHGPLELLFTVQEETGLQGAMALDAAQLQAAMLINLDSEEPEELTIGCAGGADTILRIANAPVEITRSDAVNCELVVSGLRGGHSGVQIHEPLGNAIKILTGVLRELEAAGIDFRLGLVQGGSAHNAIARDACAELSVTSGVLAALKNAVAAARDKAQSQWRESESGLSIELRASERDAITLQPETGRDLLDLLDALPHGVLEMSQAFPGKVQTSNNLAIVRSTPTEIIITTSSRSFVADDLQKVQQKIREQGEAKKAAVEIGAGYPGWEPNADSQLLQLARQSYEQVFGKPARVEVIHAGLECGVIVSKKPGLEAISFGPLIRGAHSPDEYVAASTVEPIWNLLTVLLARLS